MSFRSCILVLAAAVPLVVSSVARADVKLAYVDLQRALAEVDEGKSARTRLEAIKDAKQKELDRDQEVLKKEQETFEKQAPTMNEQTRNEKGKDLQRKFYELQQKFEKSRTDMAQKQSEEVRGIFAKMEPVINGIAQREQLTMIFDKSNSALIYAPASMDLTNEVVRIYNDQAKSAKASPAKASPAKKSDAGGKKSP